MVGFARIREWLALRIAVSGLAVHGLIIGEASGALVSVVAVAEVRLSASLAVVRRACLRRLLKKALGRPANSALHSAIASSR
eukprot:6210033-Pleurochrysis_carterae.AAC.2